MSKKILVGSMVIVFMLMATALACAVKADQKNVYYREQTSNELEGTIPPEYYDVIVWKLYGSSYEKEIKRVSYEDAMQIKIEYERIENCSDNAMKKFEKKNEVLTKFEVLSDVDSLENYQNEFKKSIKEVRRKTSLWLSVPCTIANLRNKNELGVRSKSVYSLFGLFVGDFHGPLWDKRVVGINFPLTAFVQITCSGWGPGQIFATSFGFFPIPFHTLAGCGLPPDFVSITVTCGFGHATFLPFIVNQENEGQFDFGFVTAVGCGHVFYDPW